MRIAAEVGSPPRVRGTVLRPDPLLGLQRITPACAGNSRHSPPSTSLITDHPRVCGEQMLRVLPGPPSSGSPPRVRGTVDLWGNGAAVYRITPACAGNSLRATRYWQKFWDHPRVCGEQTKKSPSFLHSFLSDQENSFSLKYNCSISSQSFCARWTSLQGSSKCFAKVDS